MNNSTRRFAIYNDFDWCIFECVLFDDCVYYDKRKFAPWQTGPGVL